MKVWWYKQMAKTGRKESKFFDQWCIENNLEWILSLWDYKKNNISPSEVGFGTAYKYYFKCPRGLHDSELSTINCITGEKHQRRFCRKCSSFGQWCVDNDRQDLLNRWDYDKNLLSPYDVYATSNKKYYFTCPIHNPLHPSSLKILNNIIKQEGSQKCDGCESFGQWCIDNVDKDFLQKYWSDNNTTSPFALSRKSERKVLIKCQDIAYHEYAISCGNFISGERCGYCAGKKVHANDSTGARYPKIISMWSAKNKKSAYEYLPYSNKKVWFECEKHGIYQYKISDMIKMGCECTYCTQEENSSALQKKVSEFLEKDLGYKVLHERNCNLLPYNPNTGCAMPYDNEVPELKLIIEVHGQQHYEITSFTRSTALVQNITFEEALKKQQWRDQYKKEYALSKGYYYLEIPYNSNNNQNDYQMFIIDTINFINQECVTTAG